MRAVFRETLLEIHAWHCQVRPSQNASWVIRNDDFGALGRWTRPYDMFLYVSMSAPGIRRQQWELCHWHRPGIVGSIIDVSMYPQASNFISIVFNRAQINERLMRVSLTWPLWFLIMPEFALKLTSSKHLWEIDRRILLRLPQEILVL